jgi:hypothetical protein
MSSTQLDIAIIQYQDRRAEIARRSQAQGAVVGLALTATSAIGGFAFSSESTEILVILPFVLSGLALVYLNYAILTRRIGEYIRTELWPYLVSASATREVENHDLRIPSWEAWIAQHRLQRGRISPAGFVSFVGQAIVFGFPSVGALAVTSQLAWGNAMASLWWLALFALLGCISLVIVVELSELRRSDNA